MADRGSCALRPPRPRGGILAVEMLAAALYAVVFLGVTGIATPDAWYSPDPSYRLQTEAFLKGEAALQELPFHHRVDWILGRGGMHQGWGLGVPLLRLPFEALARAAGRPHFPDRLVFGLAHALVGLLLLRALGSPGGGTGQGDRLLLRLALVALILLSPAFLAMAHVRFHVYEEAVAYGVLASLACLALLLRLHASPSTRRWCILAGVSGLAALVRPTAAFPAGVSLLLGTALVLRAGLGWRGTAGGLALASLGPAIVLGGNLLRFGSPWEFGYSLSFSGTPVDLLSLRFGYPYQQVDTGTALRELFSWIFFAERHTRIEWLLVPWEPYRTDILRFRESYFSTFDVGVLGVLLSSWALGLLAALSRWRPVVGMRTVSSRVILLAAWSGITFVLLFAFYLRSPTLSSRYTLDFLPAAAAGGLAALLAIHELLRARSSRLGWVASAAAAALAILWIPLASAGAFRVEGRAYRDAPQTADRSAVQSLLARRAALRRRPPPELPDAYACRRDSALRSLPYNLLGWDHRAGCGVDLVTQAFFERTPCISLLVSAAPGAEDASRMRELPESLEVKAGYDRMRRAGTRAEGSRTRVFFCRAVDTLQVDAPVQAFSIRWARLTPTVPEVPALRLHEIRRETAPPDPDPGSLEYHRRP